MQYANLREEELKNKIAQHYFTAFDCTQIIGNIDFCVSTQTPPLSLEGQAELWAEAKRGNSDIYKSIVQLILTVGKARTFDKQLPPAFLGAFDAEKIAFIDYSEVQEVFYINDFNWNVAPSNHETKEFRLVYDKVKRKIDTEALLFYYENDEVELRNFIKNNFAADKLNISKTRIDKNNFITIYSKWLQTVKPTIVANWEMIQKAGIIDGDFYLADLLSQENSTLKERLFVVLKRNYYELDRKISDLGFFNSSTTQFTDNQKAHTQFWNKYERPPREAYWDYIVERRDLLVPQDVRERKGSFFTPKLWVELSQQYLADVCGDDWQDEYYIWDCAAGTGNLLHGLTNKYHIFASTLDKQDVDVMHDRIQNGMNLLEHHAFQFDFLNDDFTKLPKALQDIINDPKKRKKLVLYINPPYAEASDKKTFDKREGKRGVEQSKVNKRYAQQLGQGNAELFVQFLTRIYFEIPDCFIAQFSKLKTISGPHFIDFRQFFKAEMKKAFICPATSFDNVKGKFPIGFMIWDTAKKEKFESISATVFNKKGEEQGEKTFYTYENNQYINDWIKPYRADIKQNQLIAKFPFKGNDFQNQNIIQIVHHKMNYNTEAGQFYINQKNVKQACVYFAVRKVIPATWLNDRDQFLYPNHAWEADTDFQNDCLSYTLFTNNIQSQYGTNHWIPFTENEVEAHTKFESNFMSRYIAGKIDTETTLDLFHKVEKREEQALQFSQEASAVFEAGLALWRHYHTQASCNVNASLYDIRAHFQGRNDDGKMNTKSDDDTYNTLLGALRIQIDQLAQKIAPKLYQYGFLK